MSVINDGGVEGGGGKRSDSYAARKRMARIGTSVGKVLCRRA